MPAGGASSCGALAGGAYFDGSTAGGESDGGVSYITRHFLIFIGV